MKLVQHKECLKSPLMKNLITKSFLTRHMSYSAFCRPNSWRGWKSRYQLLVVTVLIFCLPFSSYFEKWDEILGWVM
jgi:hypothetical protein